VVPLGLVHELHPSLAIELTQAHLPAATQVIELMRTSDDERVTFMCADALIRRGAGPVRDHSAEDDQTSRINLDALSADERKALVSLLRRALGAN
jgi:hypothetical protein